ncbi:RNA polymerase, sigma subunit, SigZ [Desulfocapsa sulfexigens DSM 10523]|uniref:RNA polymerase sigma factor SigZ n=1 Tax=Desulfocapsa sulfexigens (strain DSM 10523 / SB164P1) TaxID=1167006 RepID=M1PNN8_DESSD|nr:RNA polymerase sigma factor SigZ [Desulfocapsa sulfexigens]AGF78021.1 RNA polymerase, sigma subunit, SigZ [Desulfocapsa sulfexigens DSM 10523]
MKSTENIWHEYHMKLTAFIRGKVAEDVVDDLLQDVFIKIHTRIDSLKENKKLESWLYQITRNTVIDYYRSRRPTKNLPDWIEQPQHDEKETIRKELSSCLEPMVKELPDKYREAVRLSELEHKNQKEIAEMENISLSGAKSRVQRGRALLKTMLHDCCQIEINHNNTLVSYKKKNKYCKYC